MRIERCKLCDAEIVWTVTEQGQAIPVDYEPSGRGTIELIAMPEGHVLSEVTGTESLWDLYGERLPGRYTSHNDTCPDVG